MVVTGDGEMLMGMGALATVGLQKPKNLSILVLDNEAYGETGGQASHTAGGADSGRRRARLRHPRQQGRSRLWPRSRPCEGLQDVSTGPRFANVKIDAANLERVLSNRDGQFIMNRLRGALGHAPI